MLHAAHAYSPRCYSALILVLCWPRDQLYARIDARAKAMLSQGLLEETRTLLAHGNENLPVLRSLGYAQACAYLKGELPEAELAEEIAKQTRRFAKRQMTFWRNEPHKRGWRVVPDAEAGTLSVGAEGEGRARRKGVPVVQLGYGDLVQRACEVLEKGIDGVEVWFLHAPEVLADVQASN